MPVVGELPTPAQVTWVAPVAGLKLEMNEASGLEASAKSTQASFV